MVEVPAGGTAVCPDCSGEDTTEAFDLMALLSQKTMAIDTHRPLLRGHREMWFINAGVVQYDGKNWRVPDDRLWMWVNDILRENDGTLWFGIDGGGSVDSSQSRW